MNALSRVDDFRLFLTEEEKGKATVEKYIRDARFFCEYIGDREITKREVMEYKKHLAENYAPASVNSMLVSLNCFLHFIERSDCCVKLLKIQRQMFASEKKELTAAEYRRLLKAAQGTRLELVIETICETGIRVSELKFITVDAVEHLVSEMLDALEGREHRCEFDGINTVLTENGKYCVAPITHKVTLGGVVELLEKFKAQSQTLVMPEIPNGSFPKKLYSTYISYLPKEKASFELKMNCDDRGGFTELLKTEKCGQFSVNISKPGITKGQHWHNTKWEFFVVVSGKGRIQQRKIGSDEVLNFEVSGEKIEAVHMLPGYTHNIINLSETENLVTLMWANEQFDPNKPDTFFEAVE